MPAKDPASYMREWRRRKGMNVTGQIGRPQSAKCGTKPGYYRHRRNDEQPCEECRQAVNAYMRQRRASQSASDPD
jgi:hypothetical protein